MSERFILDVCMCGTGTEEGVARDVLFMCLADILNYIYIKYTKYIQVQEIKISVLMCHTYTLDTCIAC